MGQLKVSDNAGSVLSVSLTSSPSATSMTLADASKFPVINHGGSGSDWSYATLYDAANNLEIVKVTRRDNASNTLTIVRGTAAGIEGVTDAGCRAWASTTTGVACRLIAKVINDTNAAAVSAAASAAAAAASAASAVAGVKVSDNDTTADKLDDKIAVSGALTKTILNPGGNEQIIFGVNVPVTSVFGRTGAVTLAGSDVTGALGYTPYNFGAATPYHSGNFTSGIVTGVLGYTPWHPGNFDPNSKASLSGATFSGRVNISDTGNPMFELYRPGTSAVGIYLSGSTLCIHSTNGGGWYTSPRAYLDDSGNFTANGNVIAYSDIKLKKDLERIDGALDRIDKLTGYTFTRIDSGERQTGLVAQNVEAVLPEAVSRGEDGTLGLAYGNLAGLFVEAIKELRAEIKALKEAA